MYGSTLQGEPNPDPLQVIMPDDKAIRTRQFPLGTNMDGSGAILRFTDAAGIRWVRRPTATWVSNRRPARLYIGAPRVVLLLLALRGPQTSERTGRVARRPGRRNACRPQVPWRHRSTRSRIACTTSSGSSRCT